MICPNCKTIEYMDVSSIDQSTWDDDDRMYVYADVSCTKCNWNEYYEFGEEKVAYK